MNVIQQEAMAKAVGLSRDELSASLMEREALAKMSGIEGKNAKEKYAKLRETKSAEEAAKILGDKKLAAQYESNSVQDKFNASIEKAQSVFNDLAADLQPMMMSLADGVSSIAKMASKLAPVLKTVTLIYIAFKGIKMVLGGINTLSNAFAKSQKLISTIKKGYLAMSKKGYVQDKGAAILNKMGLISDKQRAFYKSRMTFFSKAENKNKKNSLMYDRASLLNSVKRNVQAKLRNAYDFIALQFTKEGLVAKTAILIKDTAINAAQAVSNALLTTKGFLQKMVNKEKIKEGLIELKNFAKSAANFLMSVGKFALQAAISIAKIPIIGPVLAIAAGAAAVAGGMALYSKFKKPAGDMLGTADGKTQVSPKEGGIFELSKNDDFIAAPGAADAMDKKGDSSSKKERGGGARMNAALIAKVEQLIAINQQILLKSPVIEMNGNEVGQGINKSEREIQ